MILVIALLLLCVANAAQAGGRTKTKTVDAVGPKSQGLLDLENRFYGLANQIMDGYMGPVPSQGVQSSVQGPAPNPAAGKGGAAGAPRPQAPPASVAAGKGGARGNSWSNDNLMGRLLNDATAKTVASNARYDGLMREAPQLSNMSLQALARGNDALRWSRDAVGQGQGIQRQALDAWGRGREAADRSLSAGDPYFNQANRNYADAAGRLAQGETLLRQSPAAGDWWYDQAKGTYGRAGELMDKNQDALRYASETDKWYNDQTKKQLEGAETLMNTGRVPQPILEALNASVRGGLDRSMGSALNDLGSRGVLNSSVANKGFSDMSQAAADSLNRGYLDAFKTSLEGYQGNANTAANAGRAFASSNLELGNVMNSTLGHAIGLGDSYGRLGGQRVGDLLNTASGYANNASATAGMANAQMDAGSKRIQDYLNAAQGYGNVAQGYGGALQNQLGIAQGYGDLAGRYGALSGGYLSNLNANLAEREQLNNAIGKYYTNAMAPMLPAYDMLKTMHQDHWNSNKKDHIVKQGK